LSSTIKCIKRAQTVKVDKMEQQHKQQHVDKQKKKIEIKALRVYGK
jgi:hypothetical protein